MVWPFLQPEEQYRCSSASPPIGYYVNLQFCANRTSIAHLQVQRQSPTVLPNLYPRLATSFACALIRFDFIAGDLQGCISNHPWAFRIFTQGVPPAGKFESHPSKVRARDVYDNHGPVALNVAEVEEKFAKE